MCVAADNAAVRRAVIHDVALGRENTLSGVVLTSSGAGKAGAHVQAVFKGEVVAETRTDGQGRFNLRLSRGGVHVINVDKQAVQLCRAWMPGAAPPVAKRALAVVVEQEVVRGQGAIAGALGGISIGTVGITAAAVTIGAVMVTEAMDEDDNAS